MGLALVLDGSSHKPETLDSGELPKSQRTKRHGPANAAKHTTEANSNNKQHTLLYPFLFLEIRGSYFSKAAGLSRPKAFDTFC